ncbi:hypothetical protein CLOM621_06354 [Clostridium sp. M62/1]|nr:hypothetical protein CLOM621_06354 [Clostridium sp. M62/1]CBK77534.1 hypothetical protein CLS_20380 [[Clostridium] cf. saccharolyticum K10]
MPKPGQKRQTAFRRKAVCCCAGMNEKKNRRDEKTGLIFAGNPV